MQQVFQKTIAVVLFAVSPLFFWGGPGYNSARSLTELWNIGHILFFFLLSIYIIYCSACRRLTMAHRLIVCATLTFFLGALIEIVQDRLPGRTTSLLDLIRDMSGFMIAFFVVLIKAANTNFVRALSIASVSAILAVSFFSFAVVLRDENAARNAFPVLAGFEHPDELQRWKAGSVKLSRASTPVRAGRYALKIAFSTAKYSGLSLVHFPRDWRGRDALCFSIYNPAEPVMLHFRVHDALHQERQAYADRYNTTMLIGKGWNDIRIDMDDVLNGPRGRQMDLAAVQGFGLFVMEQKASMILYLDDVRLQ